MNAAVAREAIRALNLDISDELIKKGLENTVWPGRCEIVTRRPYVILDGAQNKASARAIKKTIVENFDYNKLILVLGVSNDKDIKGICSELSPVADKIILTKANSIRATKPDVLAKQFKDKEAYITESVEEARRLVRSLAGEKDLVLVTGSLFVVGEFRNAQK
jgi:dihydrofolate synthase/folylpolyglutamate synthase